MNQNVRNAVIGGVIVQSIVGIFKLFYPYIASSFNNDNKNFAYNLITTIANYWSIITIIILLILLIIIVILYEFKIRKLQKDDNIILEMTPAIQWVVQQSEEKQKRIKKIIFWYLINQSSYSEPYPFTEIAAKDSLFNKLLYNELESKNILTKQSYPTKFNISVELNKTLIDDITRLFDELSSDEKEIYADELKGKEFEILF